MTLGPPTGARYRFGIFVANVNSGELLRKGVPVKLQDQPFQLLALLLEHPAEVVSRENVRQRLWPANTFVEFDASLGVAVRKLRDALDDEADNPRFIETIPKKGYRFIAPIERLDVPPTTAPNIEPSTQFQAPHPLPAQASYRRAIALTGVALLGLSAVFISLKWRHPRTSASANATTPPASASAIHAHATFRRSVAILGFRNLPARPEEDWLSQAFTEMLNTELAAGGNLRVVSDEDVAAARRELAIGNQDSLARTTLAQLREKSGADVVLLGSFTPMAANGGRRIRLDVRLQDTFNGETIDEEAVVGKEQDLFELAARAGADLRKSLGINPLSPDDASTVRASLPSNATAIRYYSQGTAKLWAFNFVGARADLTKAIAADPDFPLAHSALSDDLWHLGYSQKAGEEAKRAIELSQHLTREDQLLVTGQYRRTISDWPQAVEAYRQLFGLRPDNLDYGLRLAAAQFHTKREDAIATLNTLRNFPPPWSEEPSIDLLEASAQIDQDFTKAREAAKRAIRKGAAQGSRLIVARGYGILCQQDSSVASSTEDFASDCEEARKSYAAAGDLNNVARTLNDAAYLYFQRGELGQAAKMWRAAATESEKVDDPEVNAATSNNLGVTLSLQGNFKEGRALILKSIPNYQTMQDQDGVALALTDLGDIAREQGSLEEAANQYQQALQIVQQIGDKSALATVRYAIGIVQTERAEFTAAQKSFEESLNVRTTIGEQQAAAETRLALARLAMEQQRPAEAETQSRQCEERFRQGHLADDELSASTVQIRALQAQNKHQDAINEAQHSAPLAAKSENIFVRLQFQIAAAFTQSSPDQFRKQLTQARKEAHQRNYPAAELEARLALAQLNLASGQTAAAQTELSTLQADARSKGFTRIANQATTASH
jgi:DNA-binding winged helix-turn-helix (wHTH) protein/tetratricopeptide (TPR) repeat protein